MVGRVTRGEMGGEVGGGWVREVEAGLRVVEPEGRGGGADYGFAVGCGGSHRVRTRKCGE